MNEATPKTEPDVFDPDRSLTPLAAYVVTLRPLRSSVPAEIRLRRLLKTALRVYDLRCTAVSAVRADARLHAKQSDLQRNAGVSAVASKPPEGRVNPGNGTKNRR